MGPSQLNQKQNETNQERHRKLNNRRHEKDSVVAERRTDSVRPVYLQDCVWLVFKCPILLF